mgnify:CR=1 FL=1
MTLRRWLMIFILSALTVHVSAQKSLTPESTSESSVQSGEKLVVLWTSGDPEVAEKMVFMYVYNAKKYEWWQEITFIIWGPSSKLLAENDSLQQQLKKMKEEGIKLEACKACADQYGVTGKLEELGVKVKYMGQPLTDYIKGDHHVITF